MSKLFLILLIAPLAFACRPSLPQKSPNKEKQAKKERLKDSEELNECNDIEPSHKAPPPAYGNKVVSR